AALLFGPLVVVAPWLDPRLGALTVTAGLYGAGMLFGASVGAQVKHLGHAIVVALVSACADVYSVFNDAGPTAQIAQSEAALALVAIPFPRFGDVVIDPILGVGDVVMTGVYFGIAGRHSLSRRATAVALGSAYVAALAVLLVLARAIPVLPFLGAAFVATFDGARDVPRSERRTAVIGVTLVAVFFLALAWIF
ncbi:MAG: hypothetical protein IT378_21880, partial [Sandaracinaceae bacterium]|nr:hypothetical protein [Sandaracinaceae bacterium]